MKKFGLLVAVFAFALLAFVGCGKKAGLVCKANMDSLMQGYGTMRATAEFGFNKDGYVDGMELEIETAFTADVTDSDMQYIKQSFEAICSNQGSGYDSCKVTQSGKTIVLRGTIATDPNNTESRKTKAEAKEYFEKNGMSFGGTTLKFECDD